MNANPSLKDLGCIQFCSINLVLAPITPSTLISVLSDIVLLLGQLL